MDIQDTISALLHVDFAGHDLVDQALRSGTFVVTACYYRTMEHPLEPHEVSDTYDMVAYFPFYDMPSRTAAYQDAVRHYDALQNDDNLHTASLSLSLQCTDH
jgi:hypothetical protein